MTDVIQTDHKSKSIAHSNNIKYNNTFNSNNKNNKLKNNNPQNKFIVMAQTDCSTVPPTQAMRLPLLLLLLLSCLSSWCIRPALGVAAKQANVNGSETILYNDCVVVLQNSTIMLKEIGSFWVTAENPCALYACEADATTGRGQVAVTEEDCGQFYCDVDSELRPQAGSCCGTCTRTKCRYNDTVYEIGKTWHNSHDCTLLECAQLPNGEPIINSYQKSCPALPPDCTLENIYEENCCQRCRSKGTARADFSEAEDIWTEEFYRNHPCVRECHPNAPPQTCHYTFVVEWYHTLSKACYSCPQNATDCNRPHCIVGDGIPRSVTVVNRMMPGPSIEVCENDIIVVNVRNDLLGESTTMHWHGMHQRQTPYMDGVPHISQCPISPHSTFRYTFKAENPGTHFWHSHTGMQRGDGMFGALIIRRPRALDPHAHLYDLDLIEHKMIVQDWVHVPGISIFADHHHSKGDNKPRNLLINGRGRFYQAIWDQAKTEANPSVRTGNDNDFKAAPPPQPQSASTMETTTVGTVTDTTQSEIEDVGFLHPLGNEISRLARLVNAYGRENKAGISKHRRSDMNGAEENKTASIPIEQQNAQSPIVSEPVQSEAQQFAQSEAVKTQPDLTLQSSKHPSMLPQIGSSQTARSQATKNETATDDHKSRSKRTADGYNITLSDIPHHIYKVRRGFRYRFRIINAEFLNCPIAISIDNHSLIAINSDGYDFEPVDVGSIVTYAGERFDFVLDANQPVGNYWVRLKGLMDCSDKFTSAFQVAILRYDTAPDVEPNGELGWQHKANGIELNTMNRGPGHVDSLTIAELTGLPYYDTVPGLDRDALKPVADYKFFVYYDFYAKDNPVFHPGQYYGFNDSLGITNRLFTPQLNHISLKFPPVALLPARNELDDSMFCNDTSLQQQGIDCRKEFCHCHHVLQVPLNSVVELIVVDEGFAYDANHPFHLHGNAFRVVGLERLGSNVTIEMIKQLDRFNLLKRNLVRPPVKDTVTVPDGGYTIIRFEAYNPGFWLFHCHIEFHAEIGMALILKVGNNDEMVPVPKNFPTCNNYMPANEVDGEGGNGNDPSHSTSTVAAEPGTDAAAKWHRISSLGSWLLLLHLARSCL